MSSMGSSTTGSASSHARRSAMRAAARKAISLESTGWYEPSYTATRTPVSGYPAITPSLMVSCTPLSTAGMSERGMRPPTTSSTNS